MRIMRITTACVLFLGSTGLLGCAASDTTDQPVGDTPALPPALHAKYTAEPIELDGRLDEGIWATATRYPLSLSRENQEEGEILVDGGTVQLAHDDDYLYVAVDFQDSDLAAEGEKDHEHHYQLGDVAEVFIKPRGESWYWEMYVTPQGHKTAFFFPGRGRLGLPSHFEAADIGLDVAAEVTGTLNDWRDRDTGWTGEMRFPKADFSDVGVPFNADEPWSILVARYNYSRYLSHKEYSMCPPLSEINYHLYEEYADLILDPPPSPR